MPVLVLSNTGLNSILLGLNIDKARFAFNKIVLQSVENVQR